MTAALGGGGGSTVGVGGGQASLLIYTEVFEQYSKPRMESSSNADDASAEYVKGG
eukprot:CAMPEP_0179449168 /NCGR_PEP_ID=MMETSP0799-20121207/33144_1 /TAXON_ID=46947 /ORGANISM="Geminigera cryophila, Strain CCMP2564" /LENGTH=54 /DNA_ID=CAMNT_0021242001 /DNA_START=105 /DNA_END=266 /DNA_ORIENTATION=-